MAWRNRLSRPCRRLALLLPAFVLVLTSLAGAAEPVREFLNALRERRYYDEALDYLDSLEGNPAVPAEYREAVPYERGLTLVERSRLEHDSTAKQKLLDAAERSLQQFLASHPDHLLSTAAETQLGNLTVERGRILVDRARANLDRRGELLSEARAQFERAVKIFSGLRDNLKRKLEGLPPIFNEKDEAQARHVEQRNRWRSDYLQAQLLSAAAHEEFAGALRPGSQEHSDALATAARLFGEVYDKYRRRIAGLYARQYQARCLMKRHDDPGSLKGAIAILNEVLATPDTDPEIRELKMKAWVLATEAWLKAGQYAEALERGGAWIEDARPNEQRSAELQQIRMNLAEAAIKHAAELKAKDPGSKEARTVLGKGREYANLALRHSDGDAKKRAGQLLAELGGTATVSRQSAEPKTFEEAKNLGKEAIESLSSARAVLKQSPPSSADSPSARQELAAKRKEAEQAVITAGHNARRFFHIALEKANPSSSLDELNRIRYFLCFLEFEAANYYDALALGEFLAFHYPDSAGARQAALIAMASCQKLYVQEEGEREFESQHLLKVAQYIVDRWPQEKEAEEALNALIPFLIKAGRIDDAERYVQQIPVSSPHRATAELKTGQALWAAYVNEVKAIRELESDLARWTRDGFPAGKSAASVRTDLQKAREPLETLKQRARQTLVDGVQRMQQTGEVNQVAASAALSLSQIHVDSGDAGRAIALLEDARIGPLNLVRANAAPAQREGFAEETYKVALRAYISSLVSASDGEAALAKSREVMDALTALAGASAEGERKLVQIYLGLAKDLQTQLEIVEGPARTNLAAGFEVFLTQVGQQANDFKTLNWVAETFRRMGDAFPPEGSASERKPEAVRYYTKAISTYERLVEAIGKDDKFLPPGASKIGLERQLAVCQREAGQFEEAVTRFKHILSDSPTVLAVQIDAAYTYQMWAERKAKDAASLYSTAVSGWTNPQTGKLVVWGWKAIADKIAFDARFTQQFFEARYNLNLCRLKYGQAQSEKGIARRAVEVAKVDIELTARLHPELGGPSWRGKFDTLLRSIQRELGEREPRGLAAIASPPSSANPDEGSKTN